MSEPEILYEDNHVIVAVKPAGVLSQADGSDAPDMLTILKDYIKIKYNKPGNVFLGLLHRLDRNVEGVMVFAKTSKAASRISEQIRNREVRKLYRAIVNGSFTKDEGEFCNWLIKDGRTNVTKVFDSKPSSSEAKKATLRYKVTGKADLKGNMVSLVDIKLDTGRSHQIRAQFAHSGHALLGDRKYGDCTYKGNVCLQSYLIGFKHPVSGEKMEFTVPIRSDGPWSIFGGL